MRPDGRFAHCSCKNAALTLDLGHGRGFMLHFYTCSAPTARFGLLYRNMLFPNIQIKETDTEFEKYGEPVTRPKGMFRKLNIGANGKIVLSYLCIVKTEDSPIIGRSRLKAIGCVIKESQIYWIKTNEISPDNTKVILNKLEK